MIYTTATLRDELIGYRNPNDKIHRMIKEHKLFPVIKGIYTTDSHTNGKYLAGTIYGPSYLSLRCALAQYGIIEWNGMVFESVTCGKRKKRTYETTFGKFSYQDVPAEVFPLGVRQITQEGYTFEIATPEKALCDLLYTMPPAANAAELESVVFNILGVDRKRFRMLRLGEILSMGDLYHSKNVRLLTDYAMKIMIEQTK